MSEEQKTGQQAQPDAPKRTKNYLVWARGRKDQHRVVVYDTSKDPRAKGREYEAARAFDWGFTNGQAEFCDTKIREKEGN